MSRHIRVLCIVIGIVAVVRPAGALDRYVSPAGVDVPGCVDPVAPCRTIQYAIDESAASGDTIHAASGDYVENVLIGKSVVIEGAGETLTMIDGLASSLPVFQIVGSVEVLLSGLSMSGGFSDGMPGGGIHSESATVLITRCTIEGNSSS